MRVAFHNLFYFHSVHITLYSQPRRDGSLGGTFIKGMLPGERQFGKIYIFTRQFTLKELIGYLIEQPSRKVNEEIN